MRRFGIHLRWKYTKTISDLPRTPPRFTALDKRAVIHLPNDNNNHTELSRPKSHETLGFNHNRTNTVAQNLRKFIDSFNKSNNNPKYIQLRNQMPSSSLSPSDTKHWLKRINSMLHSRLKIHDLLPILSLYAYFALNHPQMYVHFHSDLKSFLIPNWWNYARTELFAIDARGLCFIVVVHSVLDIRITQQNWNLWCAFAGNLISFRREYLARTLHSICHLELQLEMNVLRESTKVMFNRIGTDMRMNIELFLQFLSSCRRLNVRFIPVFGEVTQNYLVNVEVCGGIREFVMILNELGYWSIDDLKVEVYEKWCSLIENSLDEKQDEESIDLKVLSLSVKLLSKFGYRLEENLKNRIRERIEKELEMLVREDQAVIDGVLGDIVAGFGRMKCGISERMFELWSELFERSFEQMNVEELVDCIDGIVGLNRRLSSENLDLWMKQFGKCMFKCSGPVLCVVIQRIQELNMECDSTLITEWKRLFIHRNSACLPNQVPPAFHALNILKSPAEFSLKSR